MTACFLTAEKRRNSGKTAGVILSVLFLFGAFSLQAAEVPEEKYTLEPLRDPFWPVGYFPENWQAARTGEDGVTSEMSDWDAPAKLIRVNGTSRMGDQTAAIINGEVKSAGDLVEVHYSGRIYQWKLLDVQPTGKVKLERFTVKSERSGLQKENKK